MNRKELVSYYHLWNLLFICSVLFLFLLSLTSLFTDSFIYIPLILSFMNIGVNAVKKLLEKKLGTDFFLVIATMISVIGHQEQAMTIILIIMLLAEYFE